MSTKEKELQKRIDELEVYNAALSKAYADTLSKYNKLIEQANQFIDFFQNFNNPKES